MIPVPKLDGIDETFGNINHLPKMEDIPDKFKGSNIFVQISEKWSFSGLTSLEDEGLTPKKGVDLREAMLALRACLTSWEPSHEHKHAGVAYLLSEWFDLDRSKHCEKVI